MTADPTRPDGDVRRAAPVEGEPVLMMPAAAYTAPEVLDWESGICSPAAGPAWGGSTTCSPRATGRCANGRSRSATSRHW